MERPPGGAVRPRRAPLLHLRHGAAPQDVIYLAGLLVISALLAVPVHGRRRPPVVRLRLPADGLHRDLHVDRAPLRGRPPGAAASSTPRPGRSTSSAHGRQAGRVDRARPVDRLHLRRLLHADRTRCSERCCRCRSVRGSAFWILFYGFATYGNAGCMREQVCKYMCPYARFQSAMFDRDTLIITYDARARRAARLARRAAPSRRRSARATASTARICVQVCPTGIDIRKGLQYECIGCAACIDACNGVMDKMQLAARPDPLRDPERPGQRLDAARRCGGAGAAARAGLWRRPRRHRRRLRHQPGDARRRSRPTSCATAACSRAMVEGGRIENVYRLQLMNATETPSASASASRICRAACCATGSTSSSPRPRPAGFRSRCRCRPRRRRRSVREPIRCASRSRFWPGPRPHPQARAASRSPHLRASAREVHFPRSTMRLP